LDKYLAKYAAGKSAELLRF